jgi:hypothetical protein
LNKRKQKKRKEKKRKEKKRKEKKRKEKKTKQNKIKENKRRGYICTLWYYIIFIVGLYVRPSFMLLLLIYSISYISL